MRPVPSLLALAGVSIVACRTMPASTPPADGERPFPGLDPEIADAVAGVSPERLLATVRSLAALGTRHTCADPLPTGGGIAAARELIQRELTADLGVKVVLDPFSVPKCAAPITAYNVVGSIPGSDASRLIVVGGHYDSLAFGGNPATRELDRWANAATPAPGADDSGSQAALVLESARVLSGHAFEATLVFVAFAGEEQGLLGAKAFAQDFHRLFPGGRIEAVLNNDIVGGDTSVNDEITLRQFRLYSPGAPRETGRAPDGTNDSTSPSRGLARFVGYWGGRYVPSMTAVPRLREDRISRGGDHEPFIAEGFPGVRFIETQENVAHQHSLQDVVGNISPGYLARMTRVVAASAAALARAPVAPASFAASFTGDGRIRATWAAVARADHYVLAARPVGETYYRLRRVVPLGQTAVEVTALDFGILPSEPFFISVAAVDSAGHESLFAWPELRCEMNACVTPPGALDVKATVK